MKLQINDIVKYQNSIGVVKVVSNENEYAIIKFVSCRPIVLEFKNLIKVGKVTKWYNKINKIDKTIIKLIVIADNWFYSTSSKKNVIDILNMWESDDIELINYVVNEALIIKTLRYNKN